MVIFASVFDALVIALALLLIGFSLFSALSLTFSHFRGEHYRQLPLSRCAGLILLLALCGLQLAHFAWLYHDLAWIAAPAYRINLFAVAPTFFLFSQPLLHPQFSSPLRPALLAHAVPLAVAPLLPQQAALPLAFMLGAGYLLWLARCLYQLRQERARFGLEISLLGGVFAIAIGVSVLGLMQAALSDKLFFSLYSVAIGLAFFLVQTTLALRPHLSEEVSETVQTAYASSTLGSVDCDAALQRLDGLMLTERLYIDPDLSLPGLAERLALSPHQLSELMNARLGKGFSRYLRELRIEAAKNMLLAEPSASVLSVGLSVGFTSQSNFYEAFREIAGMPPGQYRKLHTKAG